MQRRVRLGLHDVDEPFAHHLEDGDAVESVTVVDDEPDISADEVIMDDAVAANDADVADEADDATDGETHE